MRLYHMQNIKEWMKHFRNVFDDTEYTHHRNRKRTLRRRYTNAKMPIAIFENKKRFSDVMKGSMYYPQSLHNNTLSPEALCICKKPLSSGGFDHVICTATEASHLSQTHDIQELIDPLLFRGHKFHVRALFLFTRKFSCLCWDGIVLRSPKRYERGVMETEITNSSYNGNSEDDVYSLASVVKELGIDTSWLEPMTRDLHARFACHCDDDSKYDIHGIDLMFDKNGHPYIIETNPYWYTGADAKFDIKKRMFSTLMKVLHGHFDQKYAFVVFT